MSEAGSEGGDDALGAVSVYPHHPRYEYSDEIGDAAARQVKSWRRCGFAGHADARTSRLRSTVNLAHARRDERSRCDRVHRERCIHQRRSPEPLTDIATENHAVRRAEAVSSASGMVLLMRGSITALKVRRSAARCWRLKPSKSRKQRFEKRGTPELNFLWSATNRD